VDTIPSYNFGNAIPSVADISHCGLRSSYRPMTRSPNRSMLLSASPVYGTDARVDNLPYLP
jgi:hypothetical protein